MIGSQFLARPPSVSAVSMILLALADPYIAQQILYDFLRINGLAGLTPSRRVLASTSPFTGLS